MDLKLEFVLHTADGKQIPALLFELLAAIQSVGSLAKAAKQSGVSYRKAWNLVRQWSDYFGATLLASTPGSGAVVTALGEKLLWAQSYPQTQNADAIATINQKINIALDAVTTGLDTLFIAASHCLSHDILRHLFTVETGNTMDIRNSGSGSSLRLLTNAECSVAGFHLIDGELRQDFVAVYKTCITPATFKLIRAVKRQQGFIVKAGNPLGISGINDFVRNDVTIVNRQQNSGTRLLLDSLLRRAGLQADDVNGYSAIEDTHSAVSALVAGESADVAVGAKAAAMQYGLTFLPVAVETYFYAVAANQLNTKNITGLQQVLAGAAWRQAIARLDGYDATAAGEVLDAAAILG